MVLFLRLVLNEVAELLDLAEHQIGILETGDRGAVIQFAVTDLKAVEVAVALFPCPINKRIDERMQSETWNLKS